MKFITRKVHSVLDYLVSLTLITVPFISGADKHAPEFFVPVILGILTITISIFTNYEGGFIKFIPFHIHLDADILKVLMVGFSPLIFGLGAKTTTALIVIAILEIGVVLFTDAGKQPTVRNLTIQRLNRLRQKWSRQ